MPAKQNVRNQNNSTCEFSETDDAGEPHRELIKEEKTLKYVYLTPKNVFLRLEYIFRP